MAHKWNLGTPLQWGEREFCRLLEKLPAGAYTCDPDGLITYYNQRAVDLWGRAPKLNDPVDRYCGSFKLYSSEGVPLRHEQCWMALAIKKNAEYNGREIIIERPDGGRLTALAHANPMRDESGKLFGAVNVLIDISDRKRSEDVLRRANQSKDEFLATLAHELRNPLAPIRNAVEILRRQGSVPPESRQAVEVIERQMQQMTRLIDDLLDVSRITRNRLELRKERVDLRDVILAAVETSRPIIEAAGHEFTVTLLPGQLYLDADPTRLAQAMSNLLNNAAKYTDSGGHVWLTVERDGDHVVITVKDTGIGVSAEMLPRIFDMFTQVDRSLERAQGGLGIGLTLVKRLVEMHGGTVRVASEGPGKGSEFQIRFPAARETVLARHAEAEKTTAEARQTAGGLRILAVDDNEDSVGTLGMLLQLMGHTVRVARDGQEALDVAGSFLPQVVLLDIGLPKMNGYEAAKRMRQHEWGKQIVLIAVTGWGQDADRNRAKDAGFDFHLVKPVDPAALTKLLASIGENSRSESRA